MLKLQYETRYGVVLMFGLVSVPELAILRLEVKEHDKLLRDDMVGQSCVPVTGRNSCCETAVKERATPKLQALV
jgi:hypothetical protein